MTRLPAAGRAGTCPSQELPSSGWPWISATGRPAKSRQVGALLLVDGEVPDRAAEVCLIRDLRGQECGHFRSTGEQWSVPRTRGRDRPYLSRS